MTCDLLQLATPGVAGLQPYHPGKPIEELERELGISNIVKLASNENPLGYSPRLKSIFRDMPDINRYPDGNGNILKSRLAEKHNVESNRITLGNGSNDVLELIARSVVTDKHQVIFSAHAFAVYPLVVQAIGAEAVELPAQDWGYDLPAIQASLSEKTRLIFIANPNNPTGTWSSKDELRDLLETVPENVVVVIDEAYFEYVDEPEYPDCSKWLEEYSNLVVTRTFSKAYGLAGLRIGYALSHPHLADLMNRLRQPFNINAIAQIAALTVLDDDEFISKSIDVNRQGMQQLITAFDSMGLDYIPSVGNFICVDLKQPAGEIYHALLTRGVIVRPIENYGMPEHLRVTIGLEQENRKFIEALGEILSE